MLMVRLLQTGGTGRTRWRMTSSADEWLFIAAGVPCVRAAGTAEPQYSFISAHNRKHAAGAIWAVCSPSATGTISAQLEQPAAAEVLRLKATRAVQPMPARGRGP